MNITTETNQEENLINVPDWISNQLPDSEISLLQHGKKSSLIMIETPDGQELSGKMQLHKDSEEIRINLYAPNDKLKIPELLEEKKLSKAQVKALKNGEFIALDSGNKAKLDQELNKVLVYTSKELNLPIKIGTTQLSEQQVLDLLNKKSITITTLENSHHNHITTSLTYDVKSGKLIFDKGKTKILESQKRDNPDSKDISHSNNEHLITQFLEGNDKILPKIIALTKEGFNPSVEKLVELTNNFSHSRSEALLSAFNQDSKSIIRLQEISDNRILYDGMDQTKFKVVAIDLSTNKVTVQNDKGQSRQTDLDSTLRTESEQKLYLQEKSLSLTPQKTLGLGK